MQNAHKQFNWKKIHYEIMICLLLDMRNLEKFNEYGKKY